jgi:hypothetical protein
MSLTHSCRLMRPLQTYVKILVVIRLTLFSYDLRVKPKCESLEPNYCIQIEFANFKRYLE